MKSNRRKFLTKSTVVAAAVALPAAAQAQTTAGAKPVKRVHYASGKPPEKTPLFSGVVSFGNMVFIAGIGAHFEGDIKAHTKHVLDEIEKRLLSVGSSMDKVSEGERVPERLEGLRRHERSLSGTLRRRAACQNDDRRRRRHPGKFTRGDRLHRVDLIEWCHASPLRR